MPASTAKTPPGCHSLFLIIFICIIAHEIQSDWSGQDFLSAASGAVVLEDGAVTFDLSQAKYSISGEYDKCLLHLWSAERNTVRRVLDAEVKHGTLKLFVQRLGQSHPTRLE